MGSAYKITGITLAFIAVTITVAIFAPMIRQKILDYSQYFVLAFAILLLIEPLSKLLRKWKHMEDHQRAGELLKVALLVAIPIFEFADSGETSRKLLIAIADAVNSKNYSIQLAHRITVVENANIIAEGKLAASLTDADVARRKAIAATIEATRLANQLMGDERRLASAQKAMDVARRQAALANMKATQLVQRFAPRALLKDDATYIEGATVSYPDIRVSLSCKAQDNEADTFCLQIKEALSHTSWTLSDFSPNAFEGSDAGRLPLVVFFNPADETTAVALIRAFRARHFSAFGARTPTISAGTLSIWVGSK